MKIAGAKQKTYLANPDKGCIATLLYGPNNSLAESSAKKLLAVLCGNEKPEEIDGPAIKQNSALLSEKLGNLGLFDNPKAYFIPGAVDGITKEISESLEKIPLGSHLIVLAGDLPAKSSLRALFEKAGNLAAIACYEDEPHTLKAELKSMLAGAGKRIGEDTLDVFLQKISYKRYSLNTEIEKILIYLGSDQLITEELVEDLVSSNDSVDFSGFSNAAIELDRKNLYTALESSEGEGSAAITLIRGYLWYLFRLLEVRKKMEAGMMQEEALNSLQPRIHFKVMPAYRKHASANNTAKLMARIEELLDMERDIKLQKLPGSIDAIYGEVAL